MGLFLKIENPGVSPVEGWTLFGATTKRETDDQRLIGTFGSGNKHGTLLLLRNGINPTVFCGMLRLGFYTKPRQVVGVSRTVNQSQVCVRFSGKGSDGRSKTSDDELSVTLDYGTADWDDSSLALREYVSNALDACYEQGLDHLRVVIEVVNENQVRAKTGHTRVFVPLEKPIQDFYNNLGKWFLHFSEPDSLGKTILPKRDRSLEGRASAVIFRRGVRVREFMSSDIPSLFDYNLPDVKLDEARKVDDWNIRHQCAVAMRYADKDTLAKVFLAISNGEDVWETGFDSFSLGGSWDELPETTVKVQEVWKAAFTSIAGEKGVLTSGTPVIKDMVERKGFKPIITPDPWVKICKKLGVRTEDDILTLDDKECRSFSPPTPSVQGMLDSVWEWVLLLGLSGGKDKPKVECFYQPMEAGSQVWGRYANGTVFVHRDIAEGNPELLRVVILEEVAHYVTGATDMSRDFQTWLVRFGAAMMTS